MSFRQQATQVPLVRIPHLRRVSFLLLLLGVSSVLWKLTLTRQPFPLQSRAVPERSSGLSRVEETGKRLFLAICVYCHGASGDGFGLNAPNLAVPPRDFTDAAYMASRSDEQLLGIIRHGGAAHGKSTLMPSWGRRLSDREILALVNYLRAISRPPASGKNTMQ